MNQISDVYGDNSDDLILSIRHLLQITRKLCVYQNMTQLKRFPYFPGIQVNFQSL